MDKRTISRDELKQIYDFCRRKDIQYLELRMELVDHIASRIEEHWQEKPGLSFKEAFRSVYQSFGIFGLSEIAAQHENLVTKRFYSAIWQEFLSWIKAPQIILTLALSLGFFYGIQEYSYLVPILWVALGAFALGMVIYLHYFRRKLKRALNGDQSILMGSLYQWGMTLYLLYFIPINNWFLYSEKFGWDMATRTIDFIIPSFLSFAAVLVMRVTWKSLQKAKSQTEGLLLRQEVFI